MVVYEGLHTYGGMAGRDMEAVAIGIGESRAARSHRARVGQVEYLGEKLHGLWASRSSCPIGSHGGLPRRQGLPAASRRKTQFPAQTLAAELYLECGVRAMERGIVSRRQGPGDGRESPPRLELVRLTIPRRVYTQAHMDVVAESVAEVFDRARGDARAEAWSMSPKYLRFFQARFEPLA